ncbi:ATP-binding cassette domain-containing protein [Bartonella sp. DGB1]|uniref:ATP-binding cassette domain-containing protein n=1 Tax=Bartonella sp. DGB1 TaxID=3239807 RepID=UPI003525134F
MKLPLIEVKKLSKSYQVKNEVSGFWKRCVALINPSYTTNKILSDINFTLHSKQSIAILGPNGAGKSTLIKILTGIQTPDTGQINILGLNPHTNNKKLFKSLGVVFGHKNSLWWDLPLKYSFEMICPLYGLDPITFKKDLHEITTLLNLNHVINKPVRLLSLGERVKSELVCNLVFRPKLLFLDEPTIGLDITSKHEIRELLKSLKEERGLGYLITSHDMGDIDGYVDEIILLHNGNIKFHGNIQTLKAITPSVITITIYGETPNILKTIEKNIDAVAHRTGIKHFSKRIIKESSNFEIVLTRKDSVHFIEALTTQLNCSFSISTPSLEEMLRVKFNEFN